MEEAWLDRLSSFRLQERSVDGFLLGCPAVETYTITSCCYHLWSSKNRTSSISSEIVWNLYYPSKVCLREQHAFLTYSRHPHTCLTLPASSCFSMEVGSTLQLSRRSMEVGIPSPDLSNHAQKETDQSIRPPRSQRNSPWIPQPCSPSCLPNELIHPFPTMFPCVLSSSPGGCPNHPPVLPGSWSVSDPMLKAERQPVGPENSFYQGGSFEDWRENLKNKMMGKRSRYSQLSLLIELGKQKS